MRKKGSVLILIAVLVLVAGGIFLHAFFAPRDTKITPEEAEKLCYSVLGDHDEATGFPFSFGAVGTYEKDGQQYHVIRASWLVNNSHMSYIGDFFVSVDGKEIYNGFAQPDAYEMGNRIWNDKKKD